MRAMDVNRAHVRAGGGRRTRAMIPLRVNDVRLACGGGYCERAEVDLIHAARLVDGLRFQ